MQKSHTGNSCDVRKALSRQEMASASPSTELKVLLKILVVVMKVLLVAKKILVSEETSG